MKVIVLLAVLGLAAYGEALKCYVCKSDKIKLDEGVAATLTAAKSCDQFDASSPDEKFGQDCPTTSKSCAKVVDKENDKLQARYCAADEKNECKDNTCHCTEDLCNGSERGWPSAVLMVAALAAALTGGR